MQDPSTAGLTVPVLVQQNEPPTPFPCPFLSVGLDWEKGDIARALLLEIDGACELRGLGDAHHDELQSTGMGMERWFARITVVNCGRSMAGGWWPGTCMSQAVGQNSGQTERNLKTNG
jgi:hypothetical protein